MSSSLLFGIGTAGPPPPRTEDRQAARGARSRPLVEDLFAWFEAQIARLPGGSPTTEPICYALNHTAGLVRIRPGGPRVRSVAVQDPTRAQETACLKRRPR